MSDTARARFVEAMRHFCKCMAQTEDQRDRAEAAEKALAEQRERWGHVEHCGCGLDDNFEPMRHYRDPRCAPQTKDGK